MAPLSPSQLKFRRAVWISTIIGLPFSVGMTLLLPFLPEQPMLFWPVLVILGATGILWLASVVLLLRFDNDLGALAIGLSIGGGAILAGLGDLNVSSLWLLAPELTIRGLQIAVLTSALRLSRLPRRQNPIEDPPCT